MPSATYDTRLFPWLVHNEGIVLKWYLDPVNVPTIGMGSTWRSAVFREWWAKNKPGVKFARGVTITREEAYEIKQLQIEKEYGPPVWNYFKGANVTPHAMSAGMDMSFNAGYGSLKWSWAKLLKSGQVKAAAARFAKTATTAGGRVLAGLKRRRAEGAAIMEHNRWPSYIKGTPKVSTVKEAAKVAPSWALDLEDYAEAVKWLRQLGYKNPDLTAAIRAFQSDHPSLSNDGVLGRATRDQLQRVIDLKAKTVKRGAAPAAASTGGAAADTASPEGVDVYGEWVMYGGIVVLAAVLLWLGWRYRDEISIAFKSVAKGT